MVMIHADFSLHVTTLYSFVVINLMFVQLQAGRVWTAVASPRIYEEEETLHGKDNARRASYSSKVYSNTKL